MHRERYCAPRALVNRGVELRQLAQDFGLNGSRFPALLPRPVLWVKDGICLVLSDIIVPVLNGIEMADRIPKSRATREDPIPLLEHQKRASACRCTCA